MKQFLLLCMVYSMTINVGNAQFQLLRNYYDVPGGIVRELEEIQAEKLEEETASTALRYVVLGVTSTAEKLSKTRTILDPLNHASINYDDYKNICRSYLNPFKKSKCSNKKNYLIYAHKKILDLVKIQPINKINKGVKELIGEKYTHITNTIYLELEQLKLQAEKDNYYTNLFIK